MIMMPSHGLGPFRRFILGSVTAKVLHDAHVPVWTGTHMEQSDGPAAPPSFRTVVCAVDLGPQSRAALEWAGGLAAKCGARMVAVHAVPGIEARPARYFDAELSQILRKEARERLQALLDGCSLDAQICLGSGEAADVVRYAAERHDAGLVVIGRGSCAGSGGRLRTHAYSIIRQSPCPVVSV
jgi:nucleotide-binding universal stress UspA family protein